MIRLALDTATEACSVALGVGEAVHERWIEAPREHGDRVLGMIDDVLAEAGVARSAIDVIAFGRGPGAFTGVRIAAGLVQGIASGLDRPVVPVSTLAAIAQGVYRRSGHERIAAAIDARMGEVYWEPCRLADAGAMVPVVEACVAAPAGVPVPPGGGWVGAGTGWERYPGVLAERLGDALVRDLGRALPAARDMLPIADAAIAAGHTLAPEDALPVYLRDRVAERPRQR